MPLYKSNERPNLTTWQLITCGWVPKVIQDINIDPPVQEIWQLAGIQGYGLEERIVKVADGRQRDETQGRLTSGSLVEDSASFPLALVTRQSEMDLK